MTTPPDKRAELWIKPEAKLPDVGSLVCVLYQHWKEHKYMSTQMMCGEVEVSNDGVDFRVQSNDMTGSGSWAVELKTRKKYGSSGDKALAWCYAKDFPFPEWLPHDEHWGKI